MVEYYNPNPTCKFFKSGNPKNWYINDSSVRAVAKALNLSWDGAYDALAASAKKLHNMPTSKQALDEVLSAEGYEFVTLGKPQKGASRPTVREFIENNVSGYVVLNLADYYVTVIDGTAYDVSDKCLKSSVYSYWKKNC